MPLQAPSTATLIKSAGRTGTSKVEKPPGADHKMSSWSEEAMYAVAESRLGLAGRLRCRNHKFKWEPVASVDVERAGAAMADRRRSTGNRTVTPRSRQIDAQEPSFAYKIRESQDVWRRARELKVPLPLQAVDHKLDGARFAASFGVRTPEILCPPVPLAELRPPSRTRFTLKPVHGTSAKGVLLLERMGSGFREILSDDFHSSWSSALAAAEAETGSRSRTFYIEELLLPDVCSGGFLDDFKFYSFYGKVGLILQKRRVTRRESLYRWLNRSWECVDTGRYVTRLAPNLPDPSSKAELVAVAELLSAAVPVPFLRIDLYSTPEGGVFGEFTPHPGGFNTFSKEWDIMLGHLYEEAAARLQMDLVHRRFDLQAFWARLGR